MLRIKKTFKEINTVMIIMFSWRNFRNFSRNKTLVGLAFCKKKKKSNDNITIGKLTDWCIDR